MSDMKVEVPRQQRLFNHGKSLSEFSKWNNLRIIGNSAIGKAAIAVPVLGYLLLFNHEIVEYLKLHSTLCADCTISWRLHFFYFGCFFFAVGTVLFAIFCPLLIERQAGAHEFYEKEKDYYSAAEHMAFLVDHVLRERANTYLPPEHMYPARSIESMPLTSELSQLMGESYYLQNRDRRPVRIAILFSYVLGALLLAVPTIGTFGQVLIRVLN
jgi:hypothetical protein